MLMYKQAYEKNILDYFEVDLQYLYIYVFIYVYYGINMMLLGLNGRIRIQEVENIFQLHFNFSLTGGM